MAFPNFNIRQIAFTSIRTLGCILMAALMVGPASAHAQTSQPPPPPTFDEFDANLFVDEKPLGPGPHTLVIAVTGAFIKFEYLSGDRCLRARNEVRRQANLISFCIPK